MPRLQISPTQAAIFQKVIDTGKFATNELAFGGDPSQMDIGQLLFNVGMGVIPAGAVAHFSKRFVEKSPEVVKLIEKAASVIDKIPGGPEKESARIDALKWAAGHPSYLGHQRSFLETALTEGIVSKAEYKQTVKRLDEALAWGKKVLSNLK